MHWPDEHHYHPTLHLSSNTASSVSANAIVDTGDAILADKNLALCYVKGVSSSESSYPGYYYRELDHSDWNTDYYRFYFLSDDAEIQTGDSASFTGLTPEYEYYTIYKLTVKGSGKTKDYYASVKCTTGALTLTTQQPRVVSSGNVVVCAVSNLDDNETNVGFEWRRTDWTDDFESNKGGAYLFGGVMQGYIRNLNADKLWKYRPYYTSNRGETYYGEWIGLDPSNTSYFDPTVHTFAQSTVSGNTALLRGYVMRGSDNVVQQGFKYWKLSAGARSEAVSRVSIPKNAMTIEAEGTVMEAELTGLDYESTYCFVAFVKTSENETFYGEQQTFKTGADTSDIEEIATEQTDVHEVARYNVRGHKLDAPQRGLNIIRLSNGKTKKVMVK